MDFPLKEGGIKPRSQEGSAFNSKGKLPLQMESSTKDGSQSKQN